MNLLQSILMGLIQGLTEFLPVSSSGHLALFQILFKVNTNTGLLFDVMLHIGTLIAIFIVYWRDIIRMIVEFFKLLFDACYNLIAWFRRFRNPDVQFRKIVTGSYRKFVLLIIVSTIPTGLIGYFDSDFVNAANNILLIPGICLLITSVFLFISDRLPNGRKGPKKTTYADAFIIGIVQGIATLPGISRSGSTITACEALGLRRDFAVKYSFLMSVPAILGAMVMELHKNAGVAVAGSEVRNYIIGMLVAAVVGYIAIKLMLRIVQMKKFRYFAYYCAVIGMIAVIGYCVM